MRLSKELLIASDLHPFKFRIKLLFSQCAMPHVHVCDCGSDRTLSQQVADMQCGQVGQFPSSLR